ncbi:T9SS type A sorting domain-containing protein [Hymenobacter chitinivorans]|uniref:Putative secreted protein (Por secretion system target) n=1 Tax=Hymenobacter chitinivorans DSM 11115 TaxID=1121954 RepID=A0A2M9BLX6_9BACT|nr:T9SS type A sorting domain-containing protein [Hymenobacter chitinivorans]PJJ58925.1 putative secreted protein (Por secretion system target) [Hymenobacter chitinivorans DSM 11115]
MKKRQLLVLAALFASVLTVKAQSWKPFRQGLIYAYQPSSAEAGSDAHTFRVDSAYVTTTGDSVFTFNRMMRRAPGGYEGTFYKSHNNLFGARLQWRPGTFEYQLLVTADPTAGQSATALLLRPCVAVGTTWMASQSPLVTATLSSRGLQSFGSPAVADTLATITLSNGQVVRLSRRYGLVSATELVYPYSGASKEYVQAALPAPLLESAYSPLKIFDMQPGDELGYVQEPFSYGSLVCSRTYKLRQIKTRQQTADSLIYTYQEQSRTQTYNVPGCGFPAGSSMTNVAKARLAISLRTGQTKQFSVVFGALPMLSGEYRVASATGNDPRLVVGTGLVNQTLGGCMGSSRNVGYQLMYPYTYNNTPGLYWRGLDAMTIGQSFSPELGLGDLVTAETSLRYYTRTRGGVTSTCGTRSDFATLLPARPAQSAPGFQAFPNPVTETMWLQLEAPAQPGTSIVVQDAIGRLVWRAAVPAGQTSVPVSLRNQPAGIYLVQLQTTEGAARTVRVQKLP